VYSLAGEQGRKEHSDECSHTTVASGDATPLCSVMRAEADMPLIAGCCHPVRCYIPPTYVVHKQREQPVNPEHMWGAWAAGAWAAFGHTSRSSQSAGQASQSINMMRFAVLCSLHGAARCCTVLHGAANRLKLTQLSFMQPVHSRYKEHRHAHRHPFT
jgi:hypothetical protein